VHDLYEIALGCREIVPNDKSIYLSDVQHLPLAYKTHTGIPGENVKTFGYSPNFAPQGRPIPGDHKGAKLSGLFLNTKLASQVFYVAMLHPWKGRQTKSLAEQAGIADYVGWDARVLTAAISLVTSAIGSETSRERCTDGYMRIINTTERLFSETDLTNRIKNVFDRCLSLNDDDGCAPV